MADHGKGMLFLVEQAFVGKDETQAPLKIACVGGYVWCGQTDGRMYSHITTKISRMDL